MPKKILITGSTDGIGLATAKMLASQGHHILLHGRNSAKLAKAQNALAELTQPNQIEGYIADLSNMSDVESLANTVTEKHSKLDVLINNAGIFHVANAMTQDGLDVRFAVNTLAPYLLTQKLMPLLDESGRVINLSSAAQAPVDLAALNGTIQLPDAMAAYAQSKLALTMWSYELGLALKDKGPVIISVNPGSMLGSKMVKEAFGVSGGDINIGAKILTRASLDDNFSHAAGQYFDNDSGQFALPHIDTLNSEKTQGVVSEIKSILNKLSSV